MGDAVNWGWLVDDLVARSPDLRAAVVLSADGLVMASTSGLDDQDTEYLAAAAAGYHSLARSASATFASGPIRQIVVEMASQILFVTAVGRGTALAALSSTDADIGQIGFSLAGFVSRVGDHIRTTGREPDPAARP